MNQRQILTVSQLNRQVKRLLESQFTNIWIEGELSNLACPSSGHWYFTLKDAQAQIRCAMFSTSNKRLRFRPESGQKVLIRAKLSLYEARGDYQLIAETMQLAGSGDLTVAFEQLKNTLRDQGLFDPLHKKTLPPSITHIAVITSPTGAAIHDILTVLKRRAPNIAVTVIPVAVQGDAAAGEISQALARVNYYHESDYLTFDAIIIGRGGGSLEDLWAFNEEIVARAIFNSKIPVISAVGHETDTTIADFVADLRAPTPSAAAELISPDQADLLDNLSGYQVWLEQLIRKSLKQRKQQLDWLKKRLKHPGSRLTEQQQRLDELDIRLQQAWHKLSKTHQYRAGLLKTRFDSYKLNKQIAELRKQTRQTYLKLAQTSTQVLKRRRTRLETLMQRLNTISPLATLERGYSITTSTEHVITHYQQISLGDTLTTRLAKGTVHSTVHSIGED